MVVVVLNQTTGRGSGPVAALGVCLRGALCAASALTVFCARKPRYVSSAATLSKLWWAAAARASRLRHEAKRLSLRRQAEPAPAAVAFNIHGNR